MDKQFDEMIPRRGTGSLKWDGADRIFHGTNLLPMWIADMDFPVAPAIQEALHRRVDQRVFGYGMLSPGYYEAVSGWMSRRHGCSVPREWIVFTAGVVAALNFAVQAVTEPGDEILIPSPVYGPFFHAAEDWGRVAVRCPLKEENLFYTFDFDDMERRLTPPYQGADALFPHNPVGRVWTRQELEALADFCLRHHLIVIADEIHHDLVFQPHTMFLTVSPEIAQRTILCTAPSKTFNLAGIQASNIIIPNEELRNKYRAVVARHHAFSANSFAESAVVAAYRDSEDWLDALLSYLNGNMELFCGTVAAELPRLRVRRPEGTYMVWVDCTGLGRDPGDLKRFFAEECGLAFNDGASFGPGGAGFMRVNLACPRANVEACLRRLRAHCQ